ncbi:glucuronate isomerase [Rhodobium orientis]|uniref:Uronate isomerase n=1 Tax=Rhodobium orientis TaxID=34017 RepID=A0A327JX75_9HYPH|nr:glucuronate isomerase [Rhodobium orientis]MBB4301002.1 glucuronate isomerase [Rhodobium orientis]MBK5949669.1 glucuronate isomerase [Rhodobium orientis]RAI30206.1 glucuronate isomerase [Rhodobium orientis]
MSTELLVHEDRLFPSDPGVRALARDLYAGVRDLPLISPHGHTNPAWFAENEAFPDPATLFIQPDHYLFRMLYSQGYRLEDLGIPRLDGGAVETDTRKIWRIFADNYFLFRGTPSRMWFDHALSFVFGIDKGLSPETADEIYDTVEEKLAKPEFRPRALFDRFNIEVIATTEPPNDDLRHHDAIKASDWGGRVITAFRPDPVVDPEFAGFADNVGKLGALTGENTRTWPGYLAALRQRRAYFMERGATSTDHGHPSALTADLSKADCEVLFAKVLTRDHTAAEAEIFRAQMLTEMAAMSLDDGLVLQIHPGSLRNHNKTLFETFGRDMGADIPMQTDYVNALKPLLDRFGNEPGLSIILFTLDETAYSRELATLAGHYPTVKLGPAWWFYDSPEGMLRYRRAVTETAGFYNTVGFNDDTRAFLSIPARHDVARRIDCRFLAELVAEHRLGEAEAAEVAHDLAYRLAKSAYKL